MTIFESLMAKAAEWYSIANDAAPSEDETLEVAERNKVYASDLRICAAQLEALARRVCADARRRMCDPCGCVDEIMSYKDFLDVS